MDHWHLKWLWFWTVVIVRLRTFENQMFAFWYNSRRGLLRKIRWINLTFHMIKPSSDIWHFKWLNSPGLQHTCLQDGQTYVWKLDQSQIETFWFCFSVIMSCRWYYRVGLPSNGILKWCSSGTHTSPYWVVPGPGFGYFVYRFCIGILYLDFIFRFCI